MWLSWPEWYAYEFLRWFSLLLIGIFAVELVYCMIRKREQVGRIYRQLFYAAGAYVGVEAVFSLAFYLPLCQTFIEGARTVLYLLIYFCMMFSGTALLLLAFGVLYRRLRKEPLGDLLRWLRLSVLLLVLLELMLFNDKILFYDF